MAKTTEAATAPDWARGIEEGARRLSLARGQVEKERGALADAQAAFKAAAAECKRIERELLSLIRPRRAKKEGVAKPSRRQAEGFAARALKLLAQDGGSYSLAALVEEFGGTMGAGYQAMHALRGQGLVDRTTNGDWALTEKGRARATI